MKNPQRMCGKARLGPHDRNSVHIQSIKIHWTRRGEYIALKDIFIKKSYHIETGDSIFLIYIYDLVSVGYGLNYRRLPKHNLPMQRLLGDVRVFGSIRLCLREVWKT